MHCSRLGAFHEKGPVAVAPEQVLEFSVAETGQHRGVRDLVAVQMQDGQYGTVMSRVQKLVRVPGGSKRTCFGLAIANDAADDEIRIVERCTKRMRECVSQFAAFMNRTRSLGRDVTADTARK